MKTTVKSEEFFSPYKELTFQIAEKERLEAELVIAKKKFTSQNEEKAKRTDELLIIANGEKAKRAAELIIADEEKAKRAAELIIADEEKAKRAAELVIAKAEKAKRAAELVIAKEEKANRAAELAIANEEKENRAAELVIANSEKAKRAAELVIANSEKAKRGAVLVVANLEKAKRANELIIADKELTYQKSEKAKRAAELVIANAEKTKRAAELVIANVEKAKQAAKLIIANRELSYQTEEKSKRAAELVIADAEKAKRSAELVIANITKAKRAAELVVANVEKAKRAAELVIANKELVLAKKKEYRAEELIIANVEKAKRAAKIVIGNIEKAKRAAEFVVANKELIIVKEKEKLVKELIIVNKELTNQIIKRKQSDQALKESNEKYSQAFKSSPYSLTLTNAKDGKFIEVSDAFTSIFGFTSEEAVTNSVIGLNIWVDIEERNWVVSTLLDGGDVSGKEFLFNKKNGETLIGLFSSRIIYIKKEPCIISSISDITERKQAEFDLIKAKGKAEESDRLKTAFLTNMSHEIRTPMNGILGFAELLKEPNLTSDDQQDFIQIMQISGARMLNTINNIVDISKIESGLIQTDIKETNINEKIEFIYKFFKPEAEIKKLQLSYKNSLQSNESIIKTDNEKVYAILTNLVKNAIKFTFEGSIELGYEKNGEYLEFFVKDTGIGIQQNQKELIFERFRQGSESHDRGYEGSGLGLSIAKSYVKMLGGEIWVDSEEGKGSTFYFTIPYNAVFKEKASVESTFSEKDGEVQIKKLKILIVEDDEISYSLLTRMLQSINCDFLHAITGVEAVETCRINPDLDLILMDIRMPKMDGNEATRQIRQFNKDVIIIAQTAYAFSGDKEKAIEAGCNSYLTKPVNMTLLTELIKWHFN